MIQVPDIREKQVLFIDTRLHAGKSAIRFENDNIVFLKDGKVVDRASCHRVLAVYIVGELTVSSTLLRKAAECGVSFFFLTSSYRVYASYGAFSEGNYLLRMQQYHLSDKRELEISKKIVKNKILNQAKLLGLKKEDEKLKELLKRAERAKSLDSLRGIEGAFASDYFKEYFKETNWVRREPRAKGDVQNLLLDIGYTILFNFVDAILRLYGFDVYKGVYHRLFFARKSLATDLMEPLRPLVDKALLKAYNLGRIRKDDFYVKDGAYHLSWKNSAKYYKIFSEEIMKNKEEIFLYIQAFYRHVMNKENDMIDFKIK